MRNDCQLIEKWKAWCQGHSSKKHKKNPSLQYWVVSHLPAVRVLYSEMSTNVTDGSAERSSLHFVTSLIHSLWGRCWCRWMELRQVGWTDGTVNDYCCLYFPCMILSESFTNVLGCKTVEYAQERTRECKDQCCLIIVLLNYFCSCLALFKMMLMSLVHLLLPSASCFAVVILILTVHLCVRHYLRGWGAVSYVNKVSGFV